MVFLTLVPLVLVGGVGLFLGWSALSRSLSFLVEEVDALSRISSGISGYLQNRELALQGLAELSPLPAVDAAQRRRMLGSLLEQSQGLVRVAYHPLQGEETVAVLDPRWRLPGVDLERPSQAALAVAQPGPGPTPTGVDPAGAGATRDSSGGRPGRPLGLGRPGTGAGPAPPPA